MPLDPQHLEQLVGSRAALGRPHPAELRRQQDVVDDRQIVEQIEELEDHPDPAAAKQGGTGFAELVDPRAGDGHRAARRPVEPGDQIQQRRLPAARRAHDGDGLARFDLEADPVERRPAIVVVALRDFLDLDQRVHEPPSRCLRRGSPATRPTVGGAARAVVAARSQLLRRSAGVRDPDRAWRSALGMTPLGTTTDRPRRRTVLQVMRNAFHSCRRGRARMGARAPARVRPGARRPRSAASASVTPGEGHGCPRDLDRRSAAPRCADRPVPEGAAGRHLRHSFRDRRQSFATADGRHRREPRAALALRPLPASCLEDRLCSAALYPADLRSDRLPLSIALLRLLLGRRPAPRARRVLGDVPADAGAGVVADARGRAPGFRDRGALRDPGGTRRDHRLPPRGPCACRADRTERARGGTASRAGGAHAHRARDARRCRPPHVADRGPGGNGAIPAE